MYSDKIMKNTRQWLGLEANDTSKDDLIMAMSETEIINAFLEWEGIVGYTELIKDVTKEVYNKGSEEKSGSCEPGSGLRRVVTSVAEYQMHASKRWKQHRPLTSDEAMLLDWVLGLPGEVGEVCELIKHNIFHGETLDKMKLAKELGDVSWYTNAIATKLDIPMVSILGLNVSKLQHRYNGTVFNEERSAARHATEEKFTDTNIYKQIEWDIEQGGVNDGE